MLSRYQDFPFSGILSRDTSGHVLVPTKVDWARDGHLTPTGPITFSLWGPETEQKPQRLVAVWSQGSLGAALKEMFHQLPLLKSPKLLRSRGSAAPSILWMPPKPPFVLSYPESFALFAPSDPYLISKAKAT